MSTANQVRPGYEDTNAVWHPYDATNPFPVVIEGGGTAATGTNRGSTMTSGGTSQTLAAANSSRKTLVIENPATATGQNISVAESLFININGTAASATGGSNYAELAPGQSLAIGFNGIVDQSAITVNAATTGHRFYATEY